ncbi:SPOR domain-containing protein [Pelagibacterium xiamenense]|uniref:SPOR domain-containing protein n=1 Tax=Pelagibacterium xiamenense TaxID=2901140 RepID=UPI001E2EB1AF|nr:SPOR domain-containing protein [Pelagibacterium xiamenense]MCD7061059.1 SPOR domain-containing protein [Pelagibacterium xiamenense]
MPVFDFGFGTAHKVAQAEREPSSGEAAQQPDHDPIADLIVGAEAGRFDADRSDGAGDLFEAPPVAASGPVSRVSPDMAATAHSSGRRDASSGRDPLSEIEALIGEAARVSASGTGGRRVRSAFLGEDQDPQTVERAVDFAEDSMRIAREARSRNDHARQDIEPPMPDLNQADFSQRADEPYAEGGDDGRVAAAAPARARRRSSGIVVPALAGAVIFALIGGAYVLFFSPQQESGEPPVLTAEAGPLKEEPEEAVTASAASDSVVFNEMSGTATNEGEALVSRDETGGVTGNAVSNLITSEDGTGELVNRSVRTVTVRPDGTIVSSDDGVAGGTVLPVDRPNVPTLSDSAASEDPIGDAIVAAIGEDTAAAAPAPAADPNVSLAETAEAPAGDAAASADDPNAPRPIPRPEGLVASNATTPTSSSPAGNEGQPEIAAAVDTTATTPATTVAAAQPSATTTSVAGSGSEPAAWVQLASQRSEEVARAGVSDLQSRYGPLFNGAVPEVSRVDLGERGIYYRVRLPQPTLADANSVCDAIKGQGGDCFVLNN